MTDISYRIAKRKVVFRADASHRIGMGHFVRTLALAEMLKDKFFCVFATCAPTPYQIAEIEKVCASRIDLPGDSSHFSAFLGCLNGDEIVVLDNYYFDTDYQRRIKDKGCKLVCIDDMHDKHYVADVVINHAPLAVDQFSIELYTKLCVGYDYALLRGVFFESSPIKRRKIPFKTALICIGGADTLNLTASFLDGLARFDQIKRIIILTGNAFVFSDHLNDLVEIYRSDVDILWLKNVDAAGVVEAMSLADFGILPCSTILMEALSQGLPVISGAYVDNQLEISCALINKFSHVLIKDDFRSGSISIDDVMSLEKAVSEGVFPLVISADVRLRIRRLFSQLDSEFSFLIRRALAVDMDLYYSWATDPIVRANAFNSSEILYENHVRWYYSKLNNIQTFMYVLECQGNPVGQIRFDFDTGRYVIAYSVAVEFHGQGVGGILVKKGIESLVHDLCGSDCSICLNAKVKIDNKPSIMIFERLGFSRIGEGDAGSGKYVEFEKYKHCSC